MEFKTGKTYKAKIHDGSYKIHVLAVVDSDKIVFKWYSKHIQHWNYEVLDKEALSIRVRSVSDG